MMTKIEHRTIIVRKIMYTHVSGVRHRYDDNRWDRVVDVLWGVTPTVIGRGYDPPFIQQSRDYHPLNSVLHTNNDFPLPTPSNMVHIFTEVYDSNRRTYVVPSDYDLLFPSRDVYVVRQNKTPFQR